jgi:hypothetical protein
MSLACVVTHRLGSRSVSAEDDGYDSAELGFSCFVRCLAIDTAFDRALSVWKTKRAAVGNRSVA